MLKKEPKETGQAGCMIVFYEFEQQFMLINKAKEYGFKLSYKPYFQKKLFSYYQEKLKAMMKRICNCRSCGAFSRGKTSSSTRSK